jgi:uncharacterized protein YeaO (DUF488 family)
MVKTKRIYDRASAQDGLRILVERLWPRGVKRDDAAWDLWLKDLAPSTELRRWFGHDREKWGEFRRRYFAQLDKHGDLVSLLRRRCQEKSVTLVYSASDDECNNAVALKEYLDRA